MAKVEVMPTYEAWTRTADSVNYDVFFINPFRGLVASTDRDELDKWEKTHPYLYRVSITLNNPARFSRDEWRDVLVRMMDYIHADRYGTDVANDKPSAKRDAIALGLLEAGRKIQGRGVKRRFEEMGYDGIVATVPTSATPGQYQTEYYVFDTNQIQVIEGPLSGLHTTWPRWR